MEEVSGTEILKDVHAMSMKMEAQNGKRGGAVLRARNSDFEVTITCVQIPVPTLNSGVALGRLPELYLQSLFLIYKMGVIAIELSGE